MHLRLGLSSKIQIHRQLFIFHTNSIVAFQNANMTIMVSTIIMTIMMMIVMVMMIMEMITIINRKMTISPIKTV